MRSFLCALRSGNLSMCCFSLFLSFTVTLSIIVTLSSKTCPSSAFKPHVSIILAHTRLVRDDYARANCWHSYTTEWHSTLTHGSTFVLQCHPLLFPHHLVYRALCETLRHSRANDSARGRNWERMFLSLAQSSERQGGCFRMVQCCSLFVGTRVHFESRNKCLQKGNIWSSAMVNCT